MSDWQPLETAPIDGKLVWLAAKPFWVGLRAADMEKVHHHVFTARYDTWNQYWRKAQTGDAVIGPQYFNPEFWQPCPVPSAPPLESEK